MLTLAAFAECVGTRFRVVDPVGPTGTGLDLELIEATPLRPPAEGSGVRGDPFSLIFRGPPGGYLPQRSYRVEHERMDAADIFLVPIGPDELGMRYQAIFA